MATLSAYTKTSIRYVASRGSGGESYTRTISGINTGSGSASGTGLDLVTTVTNLFETFQQFTSGQFSGVRIIREQEVTF